MKLITNTANTFFTTQMQHLKFGCFSLLLPLNVLAQQVDFSKQQIQDDVTLTFQWQNKQSEIQNLSFKESGKAFFQPFRNFRAYNAESAQRTIVKKTLALWREQPVANVQLSVSRQSGNHDFSLQARDDESLNKAQVHLRKLSAQAQNDYLKQRYYHIFTRYDGVKAIKPDHIRIAEESVPLFSALKPTILEIVELRNIRKVTNYSLNFIQSIPYSPLESRVTSAGAGFVPPMQVLYQNQGDCDSKVTLTTSLLRNLMPRIEMIMIFIDGHALMGINAPIQGGDFTLSHNGITYVLAEPTGPATLPLGKISPESELAIHAGMYTVEEFHSQADEAMTSSAGEE